MFNHKPKDYICPFCLLVKGVENEHVYTRQNEIIYKNRSLTAFVSSHGWPNNKGIVIIVPNEHYENIYEVPESILKQIAVLSKKIALTIKKVYGCDGVSIRQHNEPAGNQDTWHYHYQIIPRYLNDKLYQNHDLKKMLDPKERKIFAEKLKRQMS